MSDVEFTLTGTLSLRFTDIPEEHVLQYVRTILDNGASVASLALRENTYALAVNLRGGKSDMKLIARLAEKATETRQTYGED